MGKADQCFAEGFNLYAGMEREQVMDLTPERPQHDTSDSEQVSPGPTEDLTSAKNRVKRSKELWKRLHREAKRMPQYKLVLATRERVAEYRAALLEKAHFINRKLDHPLRDADVEAVTDDVIDRVAIWDHSPERQRQRQEKQAAKRRRKNRARDSRIRRFAENGMSPAKIAKTEGLSRSGVRHVLKRDMPAKAKPGDQVA